MSVPIVINWVTSCALVLLPPAGIRQDLINIL